MVGKAKAVKKSRKAGKAASIDEGGDSLGESELAAQTRTVPLLIRSPALIIQAGCRRA